MLDEAFETANRLIDQPREPYQRALYQMWVGDILQRKGESEQALDYYADLIDLIDRVGAGSWLGRSWHR